MQPGTIMYGENGESAQGIGQVRPGNQFDPFVMRMLTFIGRPLLMPLMLITLDFAGATFMNARIAYDAVRDNWMDEQNLIVKPLFNFIYRKMIDKWIAAKLLTPRDDKYAHDVQCKRWPYVDPFKEAKADDQQLKNRTTNRKIICGRQGYDYEDIEKQLAIEEKTIPQNVQE